MSASERGERGPQGDRGVRGNEGERGFVGAAGATGAEGERGIPGEIVIPKGLLWKLVGGPILAALVVAAFFSYATEYKNRVNVHDGSVRGCERAVLDRRGEIVESWAGEKANRIIANDPFQSKITRDARRVQANAQHRSLLGKESRVPRRDRLTVEGRKLPEFVCADQYPKP